MAALLCNPRCLLALALAALILFVVLEAGIPLTDHASQAHAGQAWDADSIYEYMRGGNCKPTVYACPSQDVVVYYCDMGDNKSIGLVIGATIRQIITGLMARTSWWMDRCK